MNDKENDFNGAASGMSHGTTNSNIVTPSNHTHNEQRKRVSQKNIDSITNTKHITGAHLRSPSDGKFMFT